MQRRKIILSCLLGLCSFFYYNPSQADVPSVAVSIKPVHSLVAGIMAGVAAPSLIIKGSRSPHTYSLKPSDARKLSHADLVIWTGPGLEMFLEKPISALSGEARVITLIDDPTADPHLWLSPALAITIINRVLSVLIETDPQHGDLYSKNANALKNRLQILQDRGNRRLTHLTQNPFLVFHDAWGHFAQAFGLSIVGAIALNPERPPSAKRLSAIRRLIRESNIRCLFSEPQFQSPVLSTVLEGHDEISVVELDPLGAAQPAGPELYFQMMEGNLDAVISCLR